MIYSIYKSEGAKQIEHRGTTEASKQWGYTKATISKWCRDRLIRDVEQDIKGSPWRIPVNATCPKKYKVRSLKNG